MKTQIFAHNGTVGISLGDDREGLISGSPLGIIIDASKIQISQEAFDVLNKIPKMQTDLGDIECFKPEVDPNNLGKNPEVVFGWVGGTKRMLHSSDISKFVMDEKTDLNLLKKVSEFVPNNPPKEFVAAVETRNLIAVNPEQKAEIVAAVESSIESYNKSVEKAMEPVQFTVYNLLTNKHETLDVTNKEVLKKFEKIQEYAKTIKGGEYTEEDTIDFISRLTYMADNIASIADEPDLKVRISKVNEMCDKLDAVSKALIDLQYLPNVGELGNEAKMIRIAFETRANALRTLIHLAENPKNAS